MTQGFLEQTARDYDIPLSEVEKISRIYPDDFYEELEKYISAEEQRNNYPEGKSKPIKKLER